MFQFKTDPESTAFCERIATEMEALFGITRAEAIGRMNRDWRGLRIGGTPDSDAVLYHENAAFWARMIYYGNTSFWWTDPPGLTARPYA